MSDSSVLDFINHYKKSIEKHSEDRERILHCLTRLAKLKVSVAHLQQTGIGKTVNYVRKLEGEVGDLAKQLVTKWKDMVSADEKAEKAKPPVPLFSKSNGVITLDALDVNNQFPPELPIKLEPQDIDDSEPPMMRLEAVVKEENHKKSSSSSSSSDSSRSKHKSDHKTDNHHSSSRNGHSSSKESGSKESEIKESRSKESEIKESRSKESVSKESRSKDEHRKSSSSSSSKSSSEKSKHHKSSRHSSSSHSENSSSLKRKHEEFSKENETSQKKPKLEIKVEVEIKKSSSSSSSSKHRDSSSKHKEREKEKSKKVKQEEVKDEEVDGSQGMGFAEALALFDMPSSSTSSSAKKKDVQLADKIFKIPSSSKSSSSTSQSKDPREEIVKKTLKTIASLTTPPKLLVQKPKLIPLPDIVSDLPSDVSVPDYRPTLLNSNIKDFINSSQLGAQYMKPQVKNMSDADLLTESFSSKANRTRVFSGNRVQKTVPSLFEMCIRVLQENIDFLTETGGVPFDILRPVLERAKPEQLNIIEYYNTYLLDESDVLWEPHCKRKFRSKTRQEMESWREMFERCTREDEEKLSRLTRNIKQHQEKADGVVQKTMLAFVDSMVKPPRSVRHKQEIYGTNNKLVVSAAARTVGLRNIQPNLAMAGDARLRVSSGLRDDAQQSVGRRNVKPAPMMAKILSKFKR